ncbi:CDP-glycerol glycerophosphotransferase family protein [Curtobacterium sp. PhB146]|uniref:bifunctional glycosyltransferase/CDP-glycerol:glycerophosphate glycerophosphotransferase n=1 Tax=Curtobacterium sp. PhB146 TaxID=2485187 RepID=UPI001043FCE2|nr:CDP-glycerol glycerophosphotransferase family protein [Curtobacterium sp. PhB146]TCU45589.1 CDP-glycerol glycerophosphotransferase (TagB/SpsB family) [Curtobacterium sp. PhB146]
MAQNHPASRSDSLRPQIAAVIATYNVAPYLPDFLASLADQTGGLHHVQLIFVNDGSTDDSEKIIRTWIDEQRVLATVLSQPNGGVAAARNAGLEIVDADWVTFCDPDDVLASDYFSQVTKFLDIYQDESVSVVCTHLMPFDERTGERTDSHPLRHKFQKGSRVINLHVEPTVHVSAGNTFLRTSAIDDLGLRFDTRIRPNFEDGHFIARYLLGSNTHRLGVVSSAKYYYRTRGNGSSATQTSFLMEDKYTTLLRHGFLALLQEASRQQSVPRWLENTVLYDLFWYFKNELAIRSLTAAAPKHVFDEFHELMREILDLISDDAIRTFDAMGVEFAVKETFLKGYRPEPLRPDYVRLNDVDESRQEVHLTYWFSGPEPTEHIVVDDEVVAPLYGTVQEYQFYGRTLLKRRHLWIRRGLRSLVHLDGLQVSVVRGDQWGHAESLTYKQLNPTIIGQRRRHKAELDPSQSLTRYMRSRAGKTLLSWRRNLDKQKLTSDLTAIKFHAPSTRRRFEDAWVFMDRNTDANDNAEHLYRYARAHHPEINAWFVLERKSEDWDRLKAEGFRLVAYGSAEWRLLILHAAHLASSHADAYVVSPLDGRRYGRPRFKYSFLQHGITQYDLSRWLNIKPIALLVTGTRAEQRSIVESSPWVFSDREAVLTGFPRHDALLRKRQATIESDRDAIVIMPTWRQGIVGAALKGSNERLRNDRFMESEYAQTYLRLLHDERLRTIAQTERRRIVFMPHPNMRPYLADFKLPPHVEVLSYRDADVQHVLATASTVLTDYSSIAFEAAVVDVPVVYLQFDAHEFFNGMHIGRRGYFEYERDGFGPVTTDVDKAVDAIADIASNGFRVAPEYERRTSEAFPVRDGRNCERVIGAMKALDGAPRIVELDAVRQVGVHV